MSVKLYSHNPGSKSGRDLANGLGIRRVRHRGSRFRPSPRHILINWGCGDSNFPDDLFFCILINNPVQVSTASNKLSFFRTMSEGEGGPRIPGWTTRTGLVRETLEDEGTRWVARTVLQGHSGRGIRMINEPGDLVDAPLYVQYVKKNEEYRVHVVNGEVISVQRKARSREVPDDQVNWQVRNHHNGFIFARNEGRPIHPDVERQALLCMEKTGLDFGAVDVIFNERRQEAYVLEVNTAPGLVGTTLIEYVEAFRRFLQ